MTANADARMFEEELRDCGIAKPSPYRKVSETSREETLEVES